jgi:cell pole-organizing protein PopZ
MSASNLLPQAKPAQEKPAQEKPAMDRKAGYEPSMEEILASIRRIIADDQAFPASRSAPQAGKQGEVAVERGAEATPAATMAAQPAAASPGRYSPTPTELPDGVERVSDTDRFASSWRPDAGKIAGMRVEGRLQGDVVWARSPVEQQSAPPPRLPREAEWPGNAYMHADMRADAERAPPNDSGPRKDAAQPAEAKIDGPLVSPATDQAVSAAFNALVASRFLPTDESLADMVREILRPMLKAWLDDNLPIMVERLVRAEIERVARGGR